jgi:hypothetical protein|mmetsp:Transcript_2966/g.5575  ORF Transcript_2966/g.5575 Transcript_2966/m.5575 type:complete len:192 (-) Transcript_2966:437-1012(-)
MASKSKTWFEKGETKPTPSGPVAEARVWALPSLPSCYWKWCACDVSPRKELPGVTKGGPGVGKWLTKGTSSLVGCAARPSVCDDGLSMSLSDHTLMPASSARQVDADETERRGVEGDVSNRPSPCGAGMEAGPWRLTLVSGRPTWAEKQRRWKPQKAPPEGSRFGLLHGGAGTEVTAVEVELSVEDWGTFL